MLFRSSEIASNVGQDGCARKKWLDEWYSKNERKKQSLKRLSLKLYDSGRRLLWDENKSRLFRIEANIKFGFCFNCHNSKIQNVLMCAETVWTVIFFFYLQVTKSTYCRCFYWMLASSKAIWFILVLKMMNKLQKGRYFFRQISSISAIVIIIVIKMLSTLCAPYFGWIEKRW